METESFRAAARKVGILFDSKAVVRRVLSGIFPPRRQSVTVRLFARYFRQFKRLFTGVLRLSAGRAAKRADASISKGLKVLEKPRDGILKYNLVVDIIFIVNNPN